VNNPGIETENGEKGGEEGLKEEVVMNGAEEGDGLWNRKSLPLSLSLEGCPPSRARNDTVGLRMSWRGEWSSKCSG